MSFFRSFLRYASFKLFWIVLTRWLPGFTLLAFFVHVLAPSLAFPLASIWARGQGLLRSATGTVTVEASTTSSTTHAGVEEVCFGPEGRCGVALLRELGGSRRTIRMQAFTFTAQDIAGALVEARRRGLDVRVLIDANEAHKAVTLLGQLLDAGAQIRLDGAHGLAHNKIVVIDDAEVLTGSFNFSTAAERYNAENLLILRDDRPMAKAYLDNWNAHWAHSAPAGAALLAPTRK